MNNTEAEAYTRIALHRYGMPAEQIERILMFQREVFDELPESAAVRYAAELSEAINGD